VRRFNRSKEVLCGVINTDNDVAVTFGVGSTEDDNTVKTIGSLEITDILTNLLKVSSLVLTGKKVVSTSFLVGRDEVGIVNGRKRLAEIRHMTSYLTLEIPRKDVESEMAGRKRT
jgi:hypothetical protein